MKEREMDEWMKKERWNEGWVFGCMNGWMR